MPFKGWEKKDDNHVRPRVKKQRERKAIGVDSNGQPKLVPYWIAVDYRYQRRFGEGVCYKAENRSISELWFLYDGEELVLTPEEEARGARVTKKKKEREEPLIPIKARRLPIAHISEAYQKKNDGYLDFKQWLHARDQSRKDLFFHAREVLKYTKLVRRVHQPLCDQFNTKIFDGVFKKGYTLQEFHSALQRQTRVPLIWDFKKRKYVYDPEELNILENYARMMILLFPRECFKSTINIADTVQWLINCPDISILIMTAGRNLAETFLGDVKKVFYLPLGKEPSDFNLLFPEYVIRGIDGTSNEPIFFDKIRNHPVRYPSVFVSSITSISSGNHCEVAKYDDVVSNQNCNTPQTREDLNRDINISKSIPISEGKIDFVGTRYFPDDYYGVTLEAFGSIPKDDNWTVETARAETLKYFCGSLWTPKAQFIDLQRKNIHAITEDMVTLTFPEKFNFRESKALIYSHGERTFRCQYLNEPAGASDYVVSFPITLLSSHYISDEVINKPGSVFIRWDLGGYKKNSDYTAGVTGKIFQKENGETALVILDVICERFTQTEIAHKIVELHKKWHPQNTEVEDTGNIDLLKGLTNDVFRREFGAPFHNISWRPPSNDTNAKHNRIRGLEILLRKDLLWFLANKPWIEITFKQLTDYTGKKSTRYVKDDICDAMSSLVRCMPGSSIFMSKEDREQEERLNQQNYSINLMWGNYYRIFGQQSGILPPPSTIELAESASPISEIAKKYFGSGGLRA